MPLTPERNNSDTLHQMPPAVERYGNYAPIAVMSAIVVDKPRLQSAPREGKEVENPMMSGIAQLLDLDRANELSSLQPVSEIVAARIVTRYPSISKQYLEFIRAVGVGSTTRDFYIYEPEPASSVEQHPSFQLYQSASLRALSGPRPEGHPIPADAVAIADSGASWRYCLCPSLGEGVYCLDMAGPTFEPEADDFFSFVANTVCLN